MLRCDTDIEEEDPASGNSLGRPAGGSDPSSDVVTDAGLESWVTELGTYRPDIAEGVINLDVEPRSSPAVSEEVFGIEKFGVCRSALGKDCLGEGGRKSMCDVLSPGVEIEARSAAR